ncbi:YidB family protein [Roseovarius arcticus]|uniref:YidB family protein n=1 Tax=Roseovarius arcticus TaxID=2547404 RepID=UPI001110492B|nr:YidB family protein [Roseovarius arcticus]
MARGGFPSMTALLGVLAVAGFQNRDKISEFLSNKGGSGGNAGGDVEEMRGSSSGQSLASAPALQGGLGNLLKSLGIDQLLGGGLSELTDRFRQNGQSQSVDSWVGSGANRDVSTSELEQALGDETLDDLSEHTGLTREELLTRLSRELPQAVDKYTPEGHLPPQSA